MTIIYIKRCTTEADFAFAVRITKDYLRWLDADLSFQDIDSELSNFSSMFGPPQGNFLFAWHNSDLAAGVGLRRFDDNLCEMKRLFVYDAFKRQGIGRCLCTAHVQYAVELGYASMRLDTLGRMKAAMKLYESIGFVEFGTYLFNPNPTAKYMGLSLQQSNRS
jgi:ribosomal protein S18 acetylase RimI-like enzyme